ncbi:hypothetical protein BBO99_00008609, partial [Phytophthora kernoviae]
METALGDRLPEMEVRFKNVSITADIIVKDETTTEVELPTLTNVVKTALLQMSAKRHVVKKDIL